MDDDGWSELPSDLIEYIAKRLNTYVDYVRVRAVCVKWRSSLPTKPEYLVNQFPWLMLSPEREHLPYGDYHDFYNLLEDKVHRLNMPNDRRWRRCCGSSHGWLVLLEECGPAILLFNPITSIQIQLPPITTFPQVLDYDIDEVGEEYLLQSPSLFPGNPTKRSSDEMRDRFIKKVVLSTIPTSLAEDYIAVAIVDITAELAFCKKGDEAWTIIENSKYYDDVIYYEGVFYAVNHNRSFASFDVTDPEGSMKVIKLRSPVHHRDLSHAEELYLVDSFGELFMVHRLFRCARFIKNRFRVYNTQGFEVVKLNSTRTEWVKVESLWDRMLFLGKSSSLCLKATDFSGCDGNCIYFTGETNQPHNRSYHNHDSGVFSLGDGSTKELPNCTVNGNSFLPPPLWLTPNPC